MFQAKVKMSAGFLAALSAILYGAAGIILDVLGKLPPETPDNIEKVVPMIIAIVGLLINGLGLQDNIEGGKRSIWETLANFFKNPYRHLVLSALLFAVGKFIDLPGVDGNSELIAKLFLILASALKLEGGNAAARALINAKRTSANYV